MYNNLEISGLRFTKQNESVPYHNRLTYKVTIILLILLKCCRGQGGSFAKIQIINNYMYSRKLQNILIDFINNKNTFVYLRYDYTVLKSLEFMEYDELIITQKNGSYKLTNKGKNLANAIWDNHDVFIFERYFLEEIRSSLTEKLVKKIIDNLFSF